MPHPNRAPAVIIHGGAGNVRLHTTGRFLMADLEDVDATFTQCQPSNRDCDGPGTRILSLKLNPDKLDLNMYFNNIHKIGRAHV